VAKGVGIVDVVIPSEIDAHSPKCKISFREATADCLDPDRSLGDLSEFAGA